MLRFLTYKFEVKNLLSLGLHIGEPDTVLGDWWAELILIYYEDWLQLLKTCHALPWIGSNVSP